MTQNVAARLETKTNKGACLVPFSLTAFLITVSSAADFPPGLFRQLTTCQTAANEFLRQFWTSIYPPPSDLPTPTSTASQRSAKAAKMAGYLSKTHEVVGALVRAAVLEGVEGNRVVVVRGCLSLGMLIINACWTGFETADGCCRACVGVSSCEERAECGGWAFFGETWWCQARVKVGRLGAVRMG